MKDIYVGEQPPPPYWGWSLLGFRAVTVLLGICFFALGLYEILIAGVETVPVEDFTTTAKPMVWLLSGVVFLFNGWPFLRIVRARRMILVLALVLLVLSSFFSFGAVQFALEQAFSWITYVWLLVDVAFIRKCAL